MKLLKIALDHQHWDLAAHCLILGLVKARQKQGAPSRSEISRGDEKANGKKPR